MKTSLLALGCACAFSFVSTISAQVLMIDFGPTTVGTADQTRSPYHTANGAFADTAWNKSDPNVNGSDILSGVLWSNGTTATGVSINVGSTQVAGSNSLNLAADPSGLTLTGGSITTGVYSNTSVGRDGIFSGSSNNQRSVGLQVSGLTGGTYDIYITGRNTNISTAHVQSFYAAAASASGNFDFTGYANKSLSFSGGADAQTGAWTENSNYVKFTVTLTEGQLLNIAATGGSGEVRGFLNAVQIVAIPEPSAFAAVAGLVGIAACAGLRRRRHG